MPPKLEKLGLSVSTDNIIFQDCFEITETAIETAKNNQYSEFDIISNLIESAKDLVSKGKFKAYKIMIQYDNNIMKLTDIQTEKN